MQKIVETIRACALGKAVLSALSIVVVAIGLVWAYSAALAARVQVLGDRIAGVEQHVATAENDREWMRRSLQRIENKLDEVDARLRTRE
ncbi:MAG: hypothetical protein GXP31_07820 [Kiritimatiellaeota bacterium]|nr:hypothetical protein [Kiritimatiellota bacterium]